jgi:hypothetical protein
VPHRHDRLSAPLGSFTVSGRLFHQTFTSGDPWRYGLGENTDARHRRVVEDRDVQPAERDSR